MIYCCLNRCQVLSLSSQLRGVRGTDDLDYGDYYDYDIAGKD